MKKHNLLILLFISLLLILGSIGVFPTAFNPRITTISIRYNLERFSSIENVDIPTSILTKEHKQIKRDYLEPYSWELQSELVLDIKSEYIVKVLVDAFLKNKYISCFTNDPLVKADVINILSTKIDREKELELWAHENNQKLLFEKGLKKLIDFPSISIPTINRVAM